jgi:predicted transcriptional regulator
MEVHLSPELENQLQRIAAEQGRDAESLVSEAVERLVGYEEWFVREANKDSPPLTEANSSNTPRSAN